MVERHAGACVEQGWLLLPVVHRNFAAGDLVAAHAAALMAGEIADRFGDADLAAFLLQRDLGLQSGLWGIGPKRAHRRPP